MSTFGTQPKTGFGSTTFGGGFGTGTSTFGAGAGTGPGAYSFNATPPAGQRLENIPIENLNNPEYVVKIYEIIHQQNHLSNDLDNILDEITQEANQLDSALPSLISNTLSMRSTIKQTLATRAELLDTIKSDEQTIRSIETILEQMKQPDYSQKIYQTGTSQSISFFWDLSQHLENKLREINVQLNMIQEELQLLYEGKQPNNPDEIPHLLDRLKKTTLAITSSVVTVHNSIREVVSTFLFFLKQYYPQQSQQLVSLLEEMIRS
ncbi:hypothetical protein BLNAU_4484 [Blattamonas nauphoetae]|uniref:Nucleoporin Nup54 alpha-helical domain-containing protein n=1 Tax=Blattamonas nauphoetae TaxID=2049346 RepID=A0ABQ9YA19_9EUKA|nr:hypothetical protein BLNAU_4484 [Blattamonas nauphoetae]